jgi:ADP-ribose pyrophosphatase YjhB (NUDIX family)
MFKEDVFHLGVKTIIRHKDKILMLKVEKGHKNYWDLPGGRVQINENAEATARREVAEETGITNLSNLFHAGMLTSNIRIPMHDEHTVGLIFSFYCAQTDTDLVMLSEEHQQYEWLEEKEAQERLAVMYGKKISEFNFLSGVAQQLSQYDIEGSIVAWQSFLKDRPWQELISGCTPKSGGCGIIYELPNFIVRKGESFAIADMRAIPYSEPHYHLRGTEIYFVVQGGGIVVVGNQEYEVQEGAVIVTQPLTTHYVIPNKECVIAVVNIPEFSIDDYCPVNATQRDVKFDKAQFEQLAKG